MVVRAIRTDQLVDSAIARHGFENSDVGCGVMYPEPGDDPRTTHIPSGHIPSGYVEIYAGWGAPEGFEAITTEGNYLNILAAALRADGAMEAADRLDTFRTQLAAPG